MLSRDRHQRNGSVIQPHRHRDRVMVAGTRMEQIDAIAKILLHADAGINVLKKRQPRLGGDIVAARHTLLLGQATPLLPAAERLVVVRRQAQRLTPGFGPDAAARHPIVQGFIVERVVAQQPGAHPPALAETNIADQTRIPLGDRVLIPGKVVAVILQRDKPAPFAAGKIALFIHQQIDVGVAPRRKPVLQLVADLVPQFTDGKYSRLFAGCQPVIAHTGFAKFLRHLGKVLCVVVDLRRQAEVG